MARSFRKTALLVLAVLLAAAGTLSSQVAHAASTGQHASAAPTAPLAPGTIVTTTD